MQTPLVFDQSFVLVIGLGVANSFAVYSMWRAQAISLSRQALFTFMDDVIPVIMGFIFLGEVRLLTPFLIAGIVLCFGGAIYYGILESRAKAAKEKAKEGEEKPYSIFVWIGIYSVIWGVAHFAFRAYAVAGMPIATFLLGWYGGAFVGSNVVMLVMGKKEMGAPLPRKQMTLVSLLALVVAICLALEYWASMHAPLAVTQPIFQVTEMIFPTLIGLFYFKEIKELGGSKKVVFGIAFIGSLMVAIGFAFGI